MQSLKGVEKKTSKRWRSKGVEMGVCRKAETLGPTSVCDCENKSAEKGGPDVRESVMQSLKTRH